MKIFVSSTYKDLISHRAAVTDVLQRMKKQLAAMEFFGSRADEAIPACKKEIDECSILIGIYAWRYGWQPAPDSPSVTEEEFTYASKTGKRCLCYVVDESYPWRPDFIDRGVAADRLQRFKAELGKLVRSTFTSPDNLAKQVASDLARELSPTAPVGSFGSLVRGNWSLFSPDLQMVLATACAQAQVESDDGVVATRHVVSVLAGIPNTARCLLSAFGEVPVQPLHSGLVTPGVYELFAYEEPVSSCVLACMSRLLPACTPTQRLLALELAVDLLKHGTGTSVVDFRRSGVDAAVVDKMVTHIKRAAGDKHRLRQALASLTDAEVLHVAYISEIAIPQAEDPAILREHVLASATNEERLYVLVGELMRRYPQFVVLS